MEETVAVVVLTYNSEATVMETLNSIYNQDYKFIELIISDDYSTDNTINIIEKWLIHKKSRFNKVFFHINAENVGISQNFDFAVKCASAKWVKIIAGDDLLLENCISKNIDFINNSEESINFLYSKLIPFVQDNDGNKKILNSKNHEYMEELNAFSPYTQYKRLLKKDIYLSPTLFMNKESFTSVGGADLTIKNIEDWTFRLKITKLGNKLFYMPEETVMYRVQDSVSRNTNNIYKLSHIHSVWQLKQLIIYPNISKLDILYWLDEFNTYFRQKLIINIFRNKNIKLVRFINRFLKVFSPKKIIDFLL